MAINKVIYAGYVLIDISDATVTPETLAEGVVAYNAKGERIVGTMKQGGGGSSSTFTVTDEDGHLTFSGLIVADSDGALTVSGMNITDTDGKLTAENALLVYEDGNASLIGMTVTDEDGDITISKTLATTYEDTNLTIGG